MVRHRAKETLSQQHTETQKEQEEEPSLDREVTKKQKRRRGAGKEAAPDSLAIKKKRCGDIHSAKAARR